MNHAKLPQDQYELHVEDLAVGGDGYVRACDLWVDEDGHIWLMDDAVVHHELTRVSAVHVEREDDFEDGDQCWVVTNHDPDYRWNTDYDRSPGYSRAVSEYKRPLRGV